MLQVLYVSVLCGFALSWMGQAGKPLTDLIGTASQMFFRIVAIVMWAAPIGAFGAIAFTVGKFGAGSLVSLGKLLASFYITCLLFIIVVLWPICRWCGFSLLQFLRYIREELLIVIATTSSETVLPRMIAKLEAAGCEESVVGLVIPTGYSFNLDGTCLYLATAAVFLAQATNTPLTIEQQIGLLAVLLLASKGAAGVAGAAFVVLAATLAAVGIIPVESVALILGVHRLMSRRSPRPTSSATAWPRSSSPNGSARSMRAACRRRWPAGGRHPAASLTARWCPRAPRARRSVGAATVMG